MPEQLSRLFKNRGAALVAGVAAALLAVVVLIVYLNSYRSSVKSGDQLERVLVAKKLIPQGTSGDVIASSSLYAIVNVQKKQVQPEAIADPSAINGRVAAVEVYPGQQLTQGDFTTESAQSIPYELTGKQRAISIPVDATHSVFGQVAAGNFVDIYVGFSAQNIVKLFASDVFVLVPPAVGGGDAVVRINTADAAKFAYAADNERFWLVLRPQTGASPTPPETASLSALLATQATGR